MPKKRKILEVAASSSEALPKYWLLKSEPSVFSINDLDNSPNQTHCWDGVRNYQVEVQ